MKNILLLFFIVTLCACTSETKNNRRCIHMDEMEVCKNLETLFGYSDYELIPLQGDSILSPFIGMKMLVYNNNFVLGDIFYSHAVYLYDKTGKFSHRIGTKGNASKEYPVLKDFSIWNDTLSLASLSSPGDCFYQYDLNGKFIKKIEIPEKIISFARNSKGEYLINSGKNIFNSRWQITHYSSNFEKKGEYMKLDENGNNIPTYENNFSVHNASFCFHESFNNQLYLLDENGLCLSYYLDFGNSNNFENVFSGNFVKSIERLQKEGFYLINSYIETDYLVCLVLNFLKDDEIKSQFILNYDKVKNKGNIMELSEADLFLGNICIENGILYCMVSDKFVEKFTTEILQPDYDTFILKLKL